MKAFVLLRSNPYMAVSNRRGKLAIAKLPVGTHAFQFWHERIGYLKEVQVGDLKTDARGRLKVTVGTNGISLICRIPASRFEKD